ncbi:MAG: tetratricopeptide repeat protein [Acidobacteria bacterium]|nr:tetratricopeptide repeat protein [Acidobacteriota bacterium]MBS1864632.1 tetratricopeptide repeat protein [Acidobacteriota bacterium]
MQKIGCKSGMHAKGELGMKRWSRTWAMMAVAAAAMLFAAAPRAKAQDGGIAGTISDLEGKPWPNYTVTVESDQGAKTETKTDASGKYNFAQLKAGTYKIFLALPYQKEPYLAGQVKVGGGQIVPADLNLLELVAKKNPEYAAAVKKQAEDLKKMGGMKAHFEAGDVALNAAKQAKTDYAKAPADQRDALKQTEKENAEKAVTEFEAAKTAAPEKDQNLPLIYSRLADAYEEAGRADDAIAAYKTAIELKPAASFYMNLGGVQGRAGETNDATASFQKAAELDPANAAQAWRNYGIIMYKAQKMVEAIEPLKKSTELDPKNAQTWYLLASCMMADPSIYKQTANSIEVNPKPGTLEAFQHAIDLDPNGPWGKEAKAGLDQLKGMMGGVATKVNEKKKKP